LNNAHNRQKKTVGYLFMIELFDTVQQS